MNPTPSSSPIGRTWIVPGLLAVSAVMFVYAPYLIDGAPYESTMGLVQKIFYFHVPAAMVALVSAFVCGIASTMYMIKRRPGADHVALASAELSVVFGLIMLVTGPLWARGAWGVWWTWEPRLMLALVMWLVFSAYLLLRRFGGAGSEMLAATVGIFGMALVPFIYVSANIWRQHHPETTVATTLPAGMRGPFWFCVIAFQLLYVALLLARVRLEKSRAVLEEAFAELED